MASGYRYAPLEQGSFRVLMLQGAESFDDALQCALLPTRLPGEHAYTALSYVWGADKDSKAAFVNGRRISIGANLDSALRHLRRRDRSVRLWVDALCINQADVAERNHQVQHMRAIYESAGDTVIYLGDQTGGNTGLAAWNFLERNSTWSLNDEQERDYGLPALREGETSFRGDIHDVYHDVLTREWFSRVWVFQEAVVSKELSVQCGHRRVPWDDFYRSTVLPTRIHDTYGESMRQEERFESARRTWQARVAFHVARGREDYLPRWHRQSIGENREVATDVLNMLARARRLKALDPRDKLFAVLGISTGFDWRAFGTIDYSQPTDRVYEKFARDYMTASRGYRLLSYVNRGAALEMSGPRRLSSQVTRRGSWEVGEIGDDASKDWHNEYGERNSETEHPLSSHLTVKSNRPAVDLDVGPRSWVPAWQDMSRMKSETQLIVETVSPQTSVAGEVNVDDFRVFLPSGLLAVQGRILGEVCAPICPTSLRHEEQATFEALRKLSKQDAAAYQEDLLNSQILTLWARMLDLASPDQSFADLLDMTDTRGYTHRADSIEAHLVARGYRGAKHPGGFHPNVSPNFVVLADSIIDQRRLGVYSSTDPGSQDSVRTGGKRLVLLPPRAQAGDQVVCFPGAEVPFVVRPRYERRMGDIHFTGPDTPAARLPRVNGTETYMKCRFEGECWINDFREAATNESRYDFVFAIS